MGGGGLSESQAVRQGRAHVGHGGTGPMGVTVGQGPWGSWWGRPMGVMVGQGPCRS